MKNKRGGPRDLIYINGSNYSNKCFCSTGIEFYEFMACADSRPENLILVKHNFNHARWNQNSAFYYVTSQEINELIDDDVYSYGDFCWVDVNTEEEIDQLSKMQIAELLYFGHLAEPLNSILQARFAYFAHDDGWFNKIYVAKIEDYTKIVSRAVTMKLMNLTKKTFADFPNEISELLMKTTKEGLFIDFSKLQQTKAEMKLPVAVVGHYTDMDQVYRMKDKITEYRTWLSYSKKKWEISYGC